MQRECSTNVFRTIAIMCLLSPTVMLDALADAGNCAQFSAAQGSYIYIASTDELKLTAPMTMEVWVNPSLGGGEWALIMGKQQSVSDTNPWYAYRLLAASANASEKGFPRRVGYNVAPMDSGEYGVVSTTTIPVGAWTHIAGVYDGTNITVYVNGTPESSAPLTAQLRDSNLGLFIGKAPWTGYNNYNGQMDEVRLWRVARTQNQIQDAMNYSLVGDEPGLVAYWPFNDTPGASITEDCSVNSHTGILYNGAAIIAGSTAPIRTAFRISSAYVCPTNMVSPVNLAPDAEITPHSNVIVGTPRYAADGDYGTYWYSSQGQVSTNSFTLDLGREVTVGRYVHHLLQTEYYTIETSSDGVGWTNRHSASISFTPNARRTNDVFGAYSARYVRYTGRNTKWAYVGVQEFQIFEMAQPVNCTVLSFPTQADKLYTLQRRDDLQSGSWTNVVGQAEVVGTGDILWLQDTSGESTQFYRVLESAAP